jgi:flagellar assembly protein FliH
LSKIIKGRETDDLNAFGFAEIRQSERKAPAADTRSGLEAEQESVEAFEESLRSRLLEAERAAQELEREGYEKGYVQGQKDGFEFGKRSMAVVKEQLERLLAGLSETPERVFKDYRQWLVETALAVARRVVRAELETRPELIQRLIDAMLQEAEEHQSLTLVLHPEDLRLLQEHTDFKVPGPERSNAFAVKTDESIERGGCLIESDIQRIDATMETRFELIREVLESHE